MICFIACGSKKQQAGHIAVQEYFAVKIDTLISSLESLKLAAEKKSRQQNKRV